MGYSLYVCEKCGNAETQENLIITDYEIVHNVGKCLDKKRDYLKTIEKLKKYNLYGYYISGRIIQCWGEYWTALDKIIDDENIDFVSADYKLVKSCMRDN